MNKTVFFHRFRRLFGFVLTISLLGSVWAVSAQNARISIKMEDASIAQVMKEIENQTRYLFINKGVDTRDKVSIDAAQKTVQDVIGTTLQPIRTYLPDRRFIHHTHPEGRSFGSGFRLWKDSGCGGQPDCRGQHSGSGHDRRCQFRYRRNIHASGPGSGLRPVARNQFHRLHARYRGRGQPNLFRDKVEESASQIESVVVTAWESRDPRRPWPTTYNRSKPRT